MSEADRYLEAVDTDEPSKAAAQVMERLGEALKGADGSAPELAELQAAGEAIAELATGADRPAAVVDVARNEAGRVAQKARRKKDTIVDRIESATDDVLTVLGNWSEFERAGR